MHASRTFQAALLVLLLFLPCCTGTDSPPTPSPTDSPTDSPPTPSPTWNETDVPESTLNDTNTTENPWSETEDPFSNSSTEPSGPEGNTTAPETDVPETAIPTTDPPVTVTAVDRGLLDDDDDDSGLPWYAVLLIILGVLLCLAVLGFLVKTYFIDSPEDAVPEERTDIHAALMPGGSALQQQVSDYDVQSQSSLVKSVHHSAPGSPASGATLGERGSSQVVGFTASRQSSPETPLVIGETETSGSRNTPLAEGFGDAASLHGMSATSPMGHPGGINPLLGGSVGGGGGGGSVNPVSPGSLHSSVFLSPRFIGEAPLLGASAAGPHALLDSRTGTIMGVFTTPGKGGGSVGGGGGPELRAHFGRPPASVLASLGLDVVPEDITQKEAQANARNATAAAKMELLRAKQDENERLDKILELARVGYDVNTLL